MSGLFGQHRAVSWNPAADWLCPLLAFLFLANVLLLAVVYGWQRWGVIGLVLSRRSPRRWRSAIRDSNPAVAWIFFVLAMAPVAMLIVLLCTGPPADGVGADGIGECRRTKFNNDQ